MHTSEKQSVIYQGQIRHRRLSPKEHAFNYTLYMLALDLDEIMSNQINSGLLGTAWYRPIRIVEKDYIKSEPGNLRQRITNKVNSLGGYWLDGKVKMLVQARCFGLYFSPANFFFCFDKDEHCQYMLVEVSNTPWNQRHYYLVDLSTRKSTISDKNFHVSPFLDLAMKYHWRVRPPTKNSNKLLIHIENIADTTNKKVFDATLAMNKVALTSTNLWQVWLTLPHMSLKIVSGIYFQALKLFIKRVPFVSYQDKTP